MEISMREFWTVLHGMGFGAIYLLAFAGAFAGLYSDDPGLVTEQGIRERTLRLKIGAWLMAGICWATVISGTWFVYIWYRAKPPEGADLAQFPRYFLLSKPGTAGWHTFGMEWKEHVAWIAPPVATAIAYSIHYYGEHLARLPAVRRILLALLGISFGAGAVAGIFGAFINKIAATR